LRDSCFHRRVIDLLLRLSRREPRVRLEPVRRGSLTAEGIRELHAFSNQLATEDLEHFAVQLRAYELGHVFRRADTHDIVGFQFLQSMPGGAALDRIVSWGKLRVAPEFRNRGLHLLSAAVFFVQSKLRHPFTRYTCVVLASVMGFISITEALAEHTLFDPSERDGEAGAVRDAILTLADEGHYEMREDTGLFFVNIFMTAETLGRYPASFFQRPSAQVYASVNPDFRTNGCYAAFWFRFTRRNVAALTGTIARKLTR